MTIILFISVTIAMYALLLFFAVAKKDLAKYSPIPKFLSIKLLIFISFWQSIVVSGLVYVKVIKQTAHWSTDDVATGVQNTLLCGEMLIAAICHIWVYSYEEYVGVEQTRVWKSFCDAFNPRDIAVDLYLTFLARKQTDHKELGDSTHPL